jgi:hypothetical protein
MVEAKFCGLVATNTIEQLEKSGRINIAVGGHAWAIQTVSVLPEKPFLGKTHDLLASESSESTEHDLLTA